MNSVSSNEVINNYILMNMITYFVLSHFLKVIFKKEKLSDFQREATKGSSKNETCDQCDHTIQRDLPGQQLIKKELFHENGYCSQSCDP